MAAHSYVNTASEAQLNASIDAVTTTLVLSAPTYTGFPTAYPYWGIIAQGTASAEVVEVTAASGATLTIVRGQGGTPAASHSGGDSFKHIAPAKVFNDTEAHIEASTSVHGVSGSVVGTTGNQTVQDKVYRGQHRAVFSDANPPGWSNAFESNADNSSAKDGFVHLNTAGDVNRRGFLLSQSGTPRFEVFNDGTVLVTPNGSATRKGIETTTSLKAGTTLEVGTTATVTGAATVGGTLGVTGATTLSSVSTTGNASVGGTLGVTGASTLSSASVTGNATVGGTLGVTGTTTVGNLTVGGTSSHAGAATFTTAPTVYGGSIPIPSSLASTGSVASPTGEQIVWVSGVGWMRYSVTAAAWVPVGCIGGRVVTTSGIIHSGITTTETNITKLAISSGSFVEANKWYVHNVSLFCGFSAANDAWLIRVRKDTALTGQVVAEWQHDTKTAGFDDSVSLALPWQCTAAQGVGFFVSIVRSAGSGTATVYGNSKTAFWIDEKHNHASWQAVA